MRRDPETGDPDFFGFARDYLHTYLTKAQPSSPKTIQAYRISLECFLDYLAEHEHVERPGVNFDHLDRQHLKGWLAWMADERGYVPATIALRLSTVKAFLAVVVTPGRLPLSTSSCLHQVRSVSGCTPTRGPILLTAACKDNDGSCSRASATNRFALSRISSEYFRGAGMSPPFRGITTVYQTRGGSLRRMLNLGLTRTEGTWALA